MTTVTRFGRVEVAPATRQVRVDGIEVLLGGRAFDLLLALIERRDRVVTKDELLTLAWPGFVVEENNLQMQISALRRAIGHDAIATIPGQGYRFKLGPECGAAKPAPARLPPPVASLIGREREIADVLEMLKHRRLVTLVGIGGIGKTSLALALARTVSGDYRDGAWFVGCARHRGTRRYSRALESVAGPTASKALSAAVALAVFNAMIVGIMFYARLFFSLGRDGIFYPRANRFLAGVHAKSGAPRAATLLVGAISGASCILDSHVLVVLIAGIFPYLLALVSLAVLVGRSRRSRLPEEPLLVER